MFCSVVAVFIERGKMDMKSMKLLIFLLIAAASTVACFQPIEQIQVRVVARSFCATRLQSTWKTTSSSFSRCGNSNLWMAGKDADKDEEYHERKEEAEKALCRKT